MRTEQLFVDSGDVFIVDDFEMRLYSPVVPNGKLIIYHSGLHGLINGRRSVIERFIFERYYVLEVSMPMAGYNFDAIYHPRNSLYHEDFAMLDRPMRFFFEQASVGVNYLTSVHDFSNIYIVGISGGGWTTIIYAAIDPRITASYPIAGSNPVYLKEQLSISCDFEQENLDFYQYVSYLDLYLQGSSGRRQF